MRCELCGKNCRCSCKGWGCPSCNSTNKQVSLTNDLIKFWLTKDIVRERLKEIRTYLWKIDPYTLYEYLSWEIEEEKFNEVLANYKGGLRKYTPKKKPDIKEFKPTVNPERACVFNGPWVWERCIHCNSIRKYMQWKECPKYQWNDMNS